MEVITSLITVLLVVHAKASPNGGRNIIQSTPSTVTREQQQKEPSTVIILDVDGCLYDARCGLEQEVRPKRVYNGSVDACFVTSI